MRQISRRRFLRDLSLLASGTAVVGCGSAGGTADSRAGGELCGDGLSLPEALPVDAVDVRQGGSEEVLLALLPPGPAILDSLREVCAGLDWSWLNPGDRVFVKLSCNSGNAHPAVTSPTAVKAVCAELLARGAGEVLAGDQSGIAWVRLDRSGKLTGSTREMMKKNGLLAAIEESGATPWCFEEHGYEQGYFAADMTAVPGSHWSEGPFLASVLNEVDHVVTLPRLSSHLIAGCSLGHKCAIGWLRDDSRYLLHFQGETLHEKLAELNFSSPLADKHRLVITAAEKVLLDMGPDQGTVAEADPVIVIASSNLTRHDALATASLAFMDAATPPAEGLFATYGPDQADKANRLLLDVLVPARYGAPWGDRDPELYTPVPFHEYAKGIESNRVLARAFELQGGIPESIPVRLSGLEPSAELRAFLEAFGGGILHLAGS